MPVISNYSISANVEGGGMWFVVSSSAPIVNNVINRAKADLGLRFNEATRVLPVLDMATKDIVGAAQISGNPTILMKTSAVGMNVKSSDGLSVLWFKLLERDGTPIAFEGQAGISALVSYPQWGCGFPVFCGNCPETPVIQSQGEGSWGKAVPVVMDRRRVNAMAILDGDQKFLDATAVLLVRQVTAGDKKIFLLVPSYDIARLPKRSLPMLHGMAFPAIAQDAKESPAAEAGVKLMNSGSPDANETQILKAVPDYRIEIGELPFGKSAIKGASELKSQEGSNKPSGAKATGADPTRFYEADHYQWWQDETDRYEY